MNKLPILLCSLLLALAGCGRAVPVVDPAAKLRPEPWSQAVVEAMRAIPVQHEGRVKPFDTLASFTLYSIHGRRDMQFCWGEQKDKVTLTPTEWLLDVLFYPDQAAEYPLFRIENVEVFRALWPEQRHEQRPDLEFLSFAKLAPVGDKLLDLTRKLEAKKDVKEMEPGEQALVALRDRLMTYYQFLEDYPHVLGAHLPIKGEKLLALFDGHDHASFADVLQHGREIRALAQALRDAPAETQGTAVLILQNLQNLSMQTAHSAAFFPPLVDKAQQERWLTLGDLAGMALAGNLPPQQADRLRQFETAALDANHATREEALLAFQRQTVAGAQTRGEYGKVDLEAKYYVWNLAYSALHWFLTGFLMVAFSWLFPRLRWIGWGAAGFTVIGLGYLIADIVVRCLITGRPPIKNLYDTFLFIAAVGVSAALVTEAVTRRRIALSVAPILGALLIMLARTFEVMDGSDTMRQLQAVLDSNYWLATHVTTINIGYSAGMLGMLLANFWLVIRAFRIWDTQPATQKLIVRMVYGVTCFGLLFSVVGTILGGVWANDSWGRFWGWDPKENGALLICLAQTALLHARMSGLVRDFGFCLGAAATGIVVAFSWFHVNLLGVGLHAYGFSSGLKRGLFTFYGVQCGFLLLGITGQLMRMAAPAPAKQHEPLSPPLPAKSH